MSSPAYLTEFRTIGAGMVAQRIIHSAVSVAPISRQMKLRIKNCPGCNRRARRMDKTFFITVGTKP